MADFLKALVITGPTATGKTALAIDLARQFDGEIVSVDSRQVYRHMDLGTGKDLAEYHSGGQAVTTHLLDVANPDETYDLFHFVADAERAVQAIRSRGKLPILCGGTALYLDALLRNYAMEATVSPDPAVRVQLDAMSLEELNAELDRLAPENLSQFQDRDNRNRVRRAIELAQATGRLPEASAAGVVNPVLGEVLLLGVYYPREEVRQRIEARLDARFAAGMVEEVRKLHEEHHVSYEKLEFFGLEYRYIKRYLTGELDFDAMRSELLNHIRQFAKRQDIFFRKMERSGLAIHWLDHGNRATAAHLTRLFLNGEPLPPVAFKMSETYYGNSVGKR